MSPGAVKPRDFLLVWNRCVQFVCNPAWQLVLRRRTGYSRHDVDEVAKDDRSPVPSKTDVSLVHRLHAHGHEFEDMLSAGTFARLRPIASLLPRCQRTNSRTFLTDPPDVKGMAP